MGSEVTMKDLFGQEIEAERTPARGPYQKFRNINQYRKADNETYRCNTCKHLIMTEMQHRYYKCELQGVSSCASSDIRLSYVCKKWEGKE